MKNKTIALNKKLFLYKETITALDSNHVYAIVGGATATDPGCVGSNYCTGLDCDSKTQAGFCCQLSKDCPKPTDNCI